MTTLHTALDNELQRVNALFSKKERSDKKIIDVYQGTDEDPFTAVIQDAHGDFLPDDYIYSWIEQYCDWAAQQLGYADLSESDREGISEFLIDASYTFSRSLTDGMSTYELLQWMQSHGHRIGAADELMDREQFDSLWELGTRAVSDEIIETLGPVIEYLTEISIERAFDDEKITGGRSYYA